MTLPMDLGQPYEGAARERIDASVELWSRNVRVVGERLGAPVVLGEFGLDMSGPGAPEFVSRMLAETESMAAGRVYWSNDHDGWGPWDARAEGDELTPGPLAHVMNRAYPRAVAGQPLELGPDDASGALSVRYAENGASGATELYLPEDVFGEEFDLTVDTPAGDDGWTSRWDGGRRVLHVTVTGAADGDETVLTVAPS